MKTHNTSTGPRCRMPVVRLALFLAWSSLLTIGSLSAQPAPDRGPRSVDPRWHALTNATVVVEPGKRIENATIVVRDGVILSVKADGIPPLGARVWDCSELTVYPGLIEPHLSIELPRPSGKQAHWNEQMVMPHRSPLQGEQLDTNVERELRSLGFTVAAIVGRDGMFRGAANVIALAGDDNESSAAGARLLKTDVYQSTAFERSRGWGGSYPNSKMGSVALYRQTLADADWYHAALAAYENAPDRMEPPAASPALAALGAAKNSGPLLFVAQDEWEILRAAKVAEEFGRTLMFLGSGREFRRLDAIAKLGLPIITPLDFPEAPKVTTLEEAESVSLRSMMTWEQSPTQPRRLVNAGLDVSLTTSRLSKRDQFPERVRVAMKHGLSADAALDCLTRKPAKLLGIDSRVGTIEAGKLANFVVVAGELFDKKAQIRDVWVSGRRFPINAAEKKEHNGRWEISLARLGEQPGVEGILKIEGSSVSFEAGDKKAKARDVKMRPWGLDFLMEGDAIGVKGVVQFSAVLEGASLYGSYRAPGETVLGWFARRVAESISTDESERGEKKVAAGQRDERDERRKERRGRRGRPGVRPGAGAGDDKAAEAEEDVAASVPETYPTPLGAFGIEKQPTGRNSTWIHNATVWTGGDAGILEDASVLIRNGKIRYVGKTDDAPSTVAFRVIDAKGKHVTPGLIDCHSHTGMHGGTNEGGQRVTSEVRVQDIIDPDDINWYRQLAGGLTAANQLHGSANAIGGQNSVVKLRWGVPTADDMRLEGAPPGIKFALGENPKRVAADTDRSDEYPQTRLGVAALIEERLLAGRDYAAAWKRYRDLPKRERDRTAPPRRDLELEAMAEIVEGKRLIHCHSYRQDEILMLCRVAQRMGFKIGTFQHVLEGYKVADAVRDASLGGSTFSDWWAYKFEVIDAIPYNAAIMHEVGVCVSINSDSNEHARRLNTEAAKAVKYGDMDPHEALQLVTLNPAKQLGVEDRVGSLEVGKDADVVIWSGDPLSYYSVCENTFVDGREYYSLERDRELRAKAESERDRLVQKLLAKAPRQRGGERGDGKRRPGGRPAPNDRPIIGPIYGGADLGGEFYGGIYYDDNEYCDEDHRGDCGCNELYQEGN